LTRLCPSLVPARCPGSQLGFPIRRSRRPRLAFATFCRGRCLSRSGSAGSRQRIGRRRVRPLAIGRRLCQSRPVLRSRRRWLGVQEGQRLRRLLGVPGGGGVQCWNALLIGVQGSMLWGVKMREEGLDKPGEDLLCAVIGRCFGEGVLGLP
jgi:hypothetical protein